MLLEVRRERVLDAALRLVHQDGYGAVTMEAVSHAAEPRVYAAYPGAEATLHRRALPAVRARGARPVRATTALIRDRCPQPTPIHSST
ncbi:hypothetical protein ACWEO2_02205 [Nocardia sp. NPDC004278]